MSQKIVYDIGFKTDKSGINSLKKQLSTLKKETELKLTISDQNLQKELTKSISTIEKVEQALKEAYNPKIDSTNLTKFNQALKASGLTIEQISNDFASLGNDGVNAFRNLSAELLTTNLQLKQTSKFLDSMATTLFNTAKWSIASGALNAITGSIQQAWGFAKNLDESLNNIRIVTGKSNEEMERFAKNANKSAQSLGASTTDYTNAALIYYQQGLSEKDTKARSDVTVKVANITKQSASEVSEQLTAIWNGYKVSAEEAELYIDKVSAVAANTAADLEELADGMSKVASAANSMGVDIDRLNAMLATTISVTRQDASSVGTAYKTIFARMGDLAVGGEDEFGVKLGQVSGALKQMGIDVLDQTGNLRDMGIVIEEVAAKWGTWTDAQQQAAAVALAGKRQYNNLISLFENWDMYESALVTSQTGSGTLQQQQDTYMDSLEAKLEKLGASAERVYDAIFDSESMKDFLNILASVIDKIGLFIDSIGGGGNLLLLLGSIATKVFSTQIADGVMRLSNNFKIAKENAIELANQTEVINLLGNNAIAKDDPRFKNLISIKQDQIKYQQVLSEEERKASDNLIKNLNEAYKIQDKLNKEREKANKALANNSLEEFKLNDKGIVSGRGSEKALEEVNKNINEYSGDITSLKKINEAITNNQFALESYLTACDQYDYKSEEMTRAEEKFIEANSRAKDALTDTSVYSNLISKYNLTEQEQKELTLALEEYNNARAASKVPASEDAKVLSAANALNEKSINILQNKVRELKGTIPVIKENSAATEENSRAEEKLLKLQKEQEKAFAKKQAISNFTQLIGVMGQLYGAINSVKNAFKILGDEGATAEEKIGAIFSSLLVAIPVVIQLVQLLGNKAAWAGITAKRGWGWIGLIMTAVAGLIALLVHLADVAEKAANKEKYAFEEAKKAAEDAKKAYDSATEAVEKLKNSFNKYDEIQKRMKSVTKGTEEWKDALEENNNLVLDLVSNYSGLANLVSVNEDGQMIIDLDDREESLKKAESQANYAKIGKYATEVAESNSLLDLEMSTQAKNIAKKKTKKRAGRKGRGAHTVTSDEVKELDVLIKDYSSQIANEEITLAEEEKSEILSKFKEIGITIDDDELINMLAKNAEVIKDNTRSLELYNQQMAQDYLTVNSDTYNQNERYQADMANILAQQQESVYQEKLASYEFDKNGNNKLATQYAELMGYQTTGFSYDDTAKSYTFLDANGNKVTMSNNTIAETVAKNEAMKAFTEEEQKSFIETQNKALAVANNVTYDSETKKFTKNGQEIDPNTLTKTGIFALGQKDQDLNISNYTIGELEAAKNMDEAQIIASLGMTDATELDTYAKMLGFSDKDEFIKITKNQITNELDAANKIGGNLTGTAATGYKNIIDTNKNLTTGDRNNLANAYAKAFEAGEDSGADALTALLTNNPNSATMIANVASATDWTSATAIDDFSDALISQGIIVDKTDEKWKTFLDTMRKSGEVTKEQYEELGFSAASWDNYVKSIGKTEAEVYDMIIATKNLTKANDVLLRSYEKFKDPELLGQIKGNLEKQKDQVLDQLKENYNIEVSTDGEISNLPQLMSLYGDDETFLQWIDEYQGYQDEIVDINLQAFEDMMSIYDDYQKNLENANSLLQLQADLYGLLKGDLEGIVETQNENILLGLESTIAEFDILAEQAKSTDEEIAKQAKESLIASGQDILKYAQNYIANLDKIFEKGLKDNIKQVFGQSFDYVSEEWDFEKSQDEKYLDDVNKNFSLDKLDRQYEKEMNMYAGNLSAQKKINEARNAEMEILRNKDKLSQADLDRANAKLSVLQAEIALEEAQRNATEMQLTRDASGNYSYTFVASEDKIAEAEERLAEAQNALYNLDKDRVVALQDEYLALYSQFESDIKEAMSISDETERAARIEQIKSQYKDQFAGLKDEFNSIVEMSGTSIGGLVNDSIMTAINSDLFVEDGPIDSLITDRIRDAEVISDILYGEDENGETLIDKIGGTASELSANTKTLAEVETSVSEIATLLPSLIVALGGEVPQFRSGGYTGAWGDSGRIAILHEKELVLNKEDTANILYAVDLVRSIMGSVGDLSSLFAEGAASVDFSGSTKVANGYEQLVQELLQNVKIEANFPGVTDRNEIQAAIDNLISLAEQKANER